MKKIKKTTESWYGAIDKFGEIEKGTLYRKHTYKYDEKGNKIEENKYDRDGNLYYKLTYKYEFDAVGNWIKKTEFKKGKPYQISEREIEYY